MVGDFRAGHTTYEDIAKLAGVSKATVSHVLNKKGRFSKETEDKVLAAVKKLGYTPNMIAKGLRGKSTGVVGFVVNNILNPYFANILRGVEDRMLNAGYSVIVCNTDRQVERERIHAEILWQKRVDGLVVSPSREGIPYLRHFVDNKVPLVFVNRHSGDYATDAVIVDYVHATHMAAQYLISQGHRRIGMINGPSDYSMSKERLEGFRLAHEEAGIPLDNNLICYGNFDFEDSCRAVESLLQVSPRPSAILATCTNSTKAAYLKLREMAIAVPDEISLVGFDNEEWAYLASPSCTIVSQPAYEMGQRAAEMLLERLNGGEREPRVERLRAALKPNESVRRLVG